MKSILNVFFITFIQFNAALLYAQGALDGYMKGKGNIDIAPSISQINAQTLIGANQQKYPVPYSGQFLSLFSAVGISPKLDLILTIPYVISAGQQGLQDGGFYLKYRPIYLKNEQNGNLGFLIGSGISLPLSNYQPTVASAIGQRAIIAPIRTIIQWDSPWGPFLNFTAGYNWRLDTYQQSDILRIRQTRPDYSPQAAPDYSTFLLKLGLPAAHYYVDGWIEWQHTSPNAGTNFIPGVEDLPQAYGISYTQVGGTVYYSEKGNRGVFCSAGKILSGRNVSRTFRITAGMVIKINPVNLKKN